MTPDEARSQVFGWLKLVRELRKVSIPSLAAGPESVLESLLEVRGRLDRMEEALASAITARGVVRAELGKVTTLYENAWETEYERRKRAGRWNDYSSGKERDAEINLACRIPRANMRVVVAIEQEVAMMVDRMWLHFNGMRAVRDELLQRVKVPSYESKLDR